MPNAHVHVCSPQQHLLPPVLGAVDDLFVGLFVPHGLLAEIRKGVATAGPQPQAHLISHRFDLAKSAAQPPDRLARRVAHRRDKLNGVLQEFFLQVRAISLLDGLNDRPGLRHHIPANWVDKRNLPLHAQGGLG